jgi:hypothetical protein
LFKISLAEGMFCLSKMLVEASLLL